jgi:predicted DNA-binding transcriptional regulator YafY
LVRWKQEVHAIGGESMDSAKSTKLKLLYLLDILEKESDEEHPIPMPELEKKLEARGVSAERKSIVRDLKTLEDFGYEISPYESNRKGYYLMHRSFDTSELRFLIDAVLSSRCITAKKSTELIEKLETLTSMHLADQLRKNRDIDERIKCSNEEFYYNIDKINRAINEDKKITFQYYEYNRNKERVLRREGHVYTLSPYDLVWNEDFYYLIGVHDNKPDFTHYRIDRMHDINIQEDGRRNLEEVMKMGGILNTSSYMKKTFRMYGGDTTTVEIRFSYDLINVVIDRFGEEALIRPMDDEHFKLIAEVNAGEGFLAWMLQFGEKAQIVYPRELRDRLVEKIDKMKVAYAGLERS